MKRLVFKPKADTGKPVQMTQDEKGPADDLHSEIDKKLGVFHKNAPFEAFETMEQNTAEPPEKEPVVDVSKNNMPVTYEEKVSRFNMNRAIMYFTVLGIMGIVFFTMYTMPTPTFLLLVWIFGMLCFLPLGLVMGWLFLNPDIRVLMLRRMRGKNYGIVHFVHRGGQRMATRIKNFDDDVIIQDTKMWILKNDGIYYLDKARNLLQHAKIDSSHIKTLPASIPVLYLDSDTMIPLTFHSVQSKSNPQQVGSVILGYIYNQLAKALFMKKGMQIFFIIVILLTAMSVAIGVQMAIWMDEVHKEVPKLQSQVSRLMELISEMQRIYGIDTEPVTPTPSPSGGG